MKQNYLQSTKVRTGHTALHKDFVLFCAVLYCRRICLGIWSSTSPARVHNLGNDDHKLLLLCDTFEQLI